MPCLTCPLPTIWPSHAYHHERFIASMKEKRRYTGLPQLQKQAHCAVVPIFPSLPEQLHHCAPRLRAMREAAHLQSQIQYWCLQKGSIKCTIAQQVKTWWTGKTLFKMPLFPKKSCAEIKIAGQFSSGMKQEVAPLPQRAAESLGFELLLKYTGLSW